MNRLEEIQEYIENIIVETTLPQSVSTALAHALEIIKNDAEIEIKIDKLRETLDELNEKSNISSEIRTQLWGLAGILEQVQVTS